MLTCKRILDQHGARIIFAVVSIDDIHNIFFLIKAEAVKLGPYPRPRSDTSLFNSRKDTPTNQLVYSLSSFLLRSRSSVKAWGAWARFKVATEH